jgi:PadR family transcriptional regulator PadR
VSIVSISDNLKRGTAELLLLTLLNKEDMYGYQLSQELARRSNSLFVIQEGSMYPTLYRMLGKGLISDRKELVGKRRTRVYYHIEPLGVKYLEEIKNEYILLNRGVLKVLELKSLEALENED